VTASNTAEIESDGSAEGQLLQNPVAVGKLTHGKVVEKTLQ
jgi:hypothetical protein